MPAAQVLRYEPGREEADCAVAALAMFLGVPYEDVLREVAVTDRWRGKRGLLTSQIRAIAKRLGTPVKLKRRVEEDDYGILLLHDHAAVLRNGLVFDPAGGIWEFEDYVKAKDAVVEGVLVERL